MSYKWPGIPNGDYSFDHGRAVWNKIINYLRRLSEKLDADIVDATADRRGMMTAADKDKLDGVEPGAEVNQNAFSSVKVGNNTIEADSKTDVVELVAGTGIELTVDTTNDKVTIGGKEATTTAAGLMSATDKSKLDGIATGAEVNQNAFSNVKIGTVTVAADSKTDTINLGVGAGVIISANATTDSITIGCVEATQSVPGIMSTSDKTKLDGIATGAEVNQNAFSNVKVGSTTVAADAKTDTLELVAGTNVTLTPDANNDKITIAATDTVYTHPTTSGNKHVPSGGTSKDTLIWSADGTAQWGLPTYINTAAGTSSGERPIWFSYLNDNQRAAYNNNFVYDPYSGAWIKIKNRGWGVTNGTYSMLFNIGESDVHRGLWDYTLDKWVVYADETKCYFNGYELNKSVPADAKFTDTVTTVSTSGSGNAVTSVTANNGALTVKKDNTFSLSNHTHSYLPLSGGTMTGAITFDGLNNIIKGADNTHQITLLGGSATGSANGAKLYLSGADHTDGGAFILQAGNANSYKQLIGKPDGTLTWDGTNVIYTHPTSAGNKHIPSGGSSGQILIWSASGTATWNNPPFVKSADISIASQVSSVPHSFKFKHPSGLMIQAYYNNTLTTDSNGRVTWTYGEAFIEQPFVQIQKLYSSQDFVLYSVNSSRVILRCNNMSGSTLSSGTTVWFNAIAIGRWK